MKEDKFDKWLKSTEQQAEIPVDTDALWNKIEQKMKDSAVDLAMSPVKDLHRMGVKKWLSWSVAASVVVIMIATVYLTFSRDGQSADNILYSQNDLQGETRKHGSHAAGESQQMSEAERMGDIDKNMAQESISSNVQNTALPRLKKTVKGSEKLASTELMYTMIDDSTVVVDKENSHGRATNAANVELQPIAQETLVASTDDGSPKISSGEANINYEYEFSENYAHAYLVSGEEERWSMGLYAMGAAGDNAAGKKNMFTTRGQQVGPYGEVEGEKWHPAVPWTVGLSAAYSPAKRWRIELGFTTTFLRQRRDIYYSTQRSVMSYNKKVYLGAQVSGSYKIWQNNSWMLYAGAGVGVQRAVSNKFKLSKVGDMEVLDAASRDALDTQWNAFAQVGLEYKVVGPLSLYLAPGVNYYFSGTDKSPDSVFDHYPLTFRLEAGLRFNINR